jgi:hypothetical protein
VALSLSIVLFSLHFVQKRVGDVTRSLLVYSLLLLSTTQLVFIIFFIVGLHWSRMNSTLALIMFTLMGISSNIRFIRTCSELRDGFLPTVNSIVFIPKT